MNDFREEFLLLDNNLLDYLDGDLSNSSDYQIVTQLIENIPDNIIKDEDKFSSFLYSLYSLFDFFDTFLFDNVNEELLYEEIEQNFDSQDINSTLRSFLSGIALRTGKKMEQEEINEYLSDETNKKKILRGITISSLVMQNNPNVDLNRIIFPNDLVEQESFINLSSMISSNLSKYIVDNEIRSILENILMSGDKEWTSKLQLILKMSDKLPYELKIKLLQSLDFLKEEHKLRLPGPGEAQIYKYDTIDSEFYTEDNEWMKSQILLAKNVLVWLWQLSRKYSKEINTLDDIPREELKELSDYGISGIWLIGIWERSEASKLIKKYTGHENSPGSAYSLWDYQIAERLGGKEALLRFKENAAEFEIKIGADMVPNHTGIYSKWIIDHPDWFISVDYPPFPSYTFNGANLSTDQNIGIFLEDGYYDHSDAAVVFKRTDFQTGRVDYIYHGNDGTSLPWNDTAQLNYLLPQVRENVISKILDVADLFDVIRFDAAMTLTRQHFQRLWFPKPGSGGDIPSRSRFSIPKDEFDKKFPNEFWKEVVNKVNSERPSTLLIAEAFWLLEGYFVRSLGMHRVYNSAFMHMIRDQKNSKYKEIIKNTLLFDPRIMQRFVNYMSNPDEETAIEQFGDEDKYFGICSLMVTLPGLPMFAHGQIEGYYEKYGMEFSKPMWDEEPKSYLINGHKERIFPLLEFRKIFSGVQNFRFYDTTSSTGSEIPSVFAYTNKNSEKKFVVVYNNQLEQVKFRIYETVKFNENKLELSSEDEAISTVFQELSLDIHNRDGNNSYLIFKDLIFDQYFARRINELRTNGMEFELNGYQFRILSEFKIVEDNENLIDENYLQFWSGSSDFTDKLEKWFK